MKKIDLLRQELSSIQFLKGNMEMPKDRISGTSFFPCGSGVYNKTKNKKSILVLDQDQDNETGFRKSLKNESECYTVTWRNMSELFKEANVNLEDCFFTNCLMGIRINAKRNVGKSPGLMDQEFLMQNVNYLKRQIQIIKPDSIIVLGLIPLKFLSLLSNELLLKTTFLDSFKEIDSKECGFMREINFEEIGKVNVAVLVHPSYRKRNCQIREYNGLKGNKAEVEILQRIPNPNRHKLQPL